LAVWWLTLFTRPGVKQQFSLHTTAKESAAPERRKTI
jgi:hypothetical protein